MKRILLLTIASLLFFAGCQKKYVRPEIQQEDQAYGTEIRYGLCNCYSAYDKEEVTFDVKCYPVNENNFTTYSTTEKTDAPAADEARLLWRDNGLKVGDVSISDKKVTVSGLSGYGNAVVAIYHQGEMLWSYHIWRPRVNPDSTVHYASIAADVMVLNLGAEDLFKGYARTNTRAYADRMSGLLYQWGRKDPLGRPALKAGTGYQTAVDEDGQKIDWENDIICNTSITDEAKNAWKIEHAEEYPDPDTLEAKAKAYIIANAGTIIRDWSMKHPTTYIYPTGSYMTFNMVSTPDTLWKQEQIYHKYWFELKNAYDPCPEGYMLPTIKLYRGFISGSTYIVDDEGGGSNYSVSSYEGINADAKTKASMDTYGGFNFLYYGSLDSSKTTFYPACGYRGGYADKGALLDVGVRGRYHGYTSTASYIRIFYFLSGSLSAQYGYNPSSTANSVRCIKEGYASEEEDE